MSRGSLRSVSIGGGHRAASFLRGIALVSTLLGFGGAPGIAGAAPLLETLVLAEGGDSIGTGCTLFAPPAPVHAFFGSVGVLVPVPGSTACGVDGDYDWLTSAGPALSDERSLTTAWGSNSYSGDAQAQARFGALGASAQSSYAGGSSGINVSGSEGLALARDELTISSPGIAPGTPGTLVARITISGALSTDGVGGAGVYVRNWDPAGGITRNVLLSQATGPGSLPTLFSSDGTGLGGFSLANGSMSGSGEVPTLPIAFTFGTPLAFEIGLFAYADPTLTSHPASSFTATLTGLAVTGPGGPVATFDIVAASGATYDASGIGRPVPALPAPALALGLAGVAGVGAAALRGRRAMRRATRRWSAVTRARSPRT